MRLRRAGRPLRCPPGHIGGGGLGVAPPAQAGVMLGTGTEAHAASNAKAKRELGWTLHYPSGRQGFAEVYAKPT
jgi:hypothetical protein